jgi:hypothetical protein
MRLWIFRAGAHERAAASVNALEERERAPVQTNNVLLLIQQRREIEYRAFEIAG